MPLSQDQQRALDTIKQKSGPFFLTGKAGTGKSYLASELKNHFRVKYTASTGVASQNIGGCTVHSLIGMGHVPRRKVEAHYKRLSIILSDFDVLVIDEISMINADLFEIIYYTLYEEVGFEGKLIFVGDFLQLAPVEGKMAFTSPLWLDSVEVINLTEQHRQSDLGFVDALDDIRFGKFTNLVTELFKERRCHELPNDCINLMPKKAPAAIVNRERLNKIPGEMYEAEHIVTKSKWGHDHKYTLARIEKAKFPKLFHFKVGARVVMLKNSEKYVNGTMGTIQGFDDRNSRISVLSDAEDFFDVYPTEETIEDAEGNPLVTHIQFPMQLAWAITIHKSQGMTLRKAGIDMEGHFSPGMTYVAISRAETRGGLFLCGKAIDILASQEAVSYVTGNYQYQKVIIRPASI